MRQMSCDPDMLSDTRETRQVPTVVGRGQVFFVVGAGMVWFPGCQQVLNALHRLLQEQGDGCIRPIAAECGRPSEDTAAGFKEYGDQRGDDVGFPF